jgi:hypothetical protein
MRMSSASLEEPGVRFPRKSTEETICRITDSRNVRLRQRNAEFFSSEMEAVQDCAETHRVFVGEHNVAT